LYYSDYTNKQEKYSTGGEIIRDTTDVGTRDEEETEYREETRDRKETGDTGTERTPETERTQAIFRGDHREGKDQRFRG
jgi:hypothetical protein